MSRQYLTLGPTPCDETCYPNTGDKKMQRIEMSAYQRQLLRVMSLEFGDNLCVGLIIKTFPHDSGSYSEVCVVYNDHPQEIAQAFWLESNCPENWDGEAEKELKEAGHIAYIPKNLDVMQREDDPIGYTAPNHIADCEDIDDYNEILDEIDPGIKYEQ